MILNKEIKEGIHHLLQAGIASGIPGLQLLIGSGEEILYSEALGYADIENSRPMSLDTPIMAASIAKQFIGLAILMLEEAGQVNIDAPIKVYFPEFKGPLKNVTIRHMLTHSSGIKEYFPTEGMAYFEQQYGTDLDEEAILKLIESEDSLDFEPGTQFKYSNSAYVMLGILIKRLSGQHFGDFLEKNFFIPLKMNHSQAPSNADCALKEKAVAYKESGHLEHEVEAFHNVSLGYGDGNLLTTVNDLHHWLVGLSNKKWVDDELMASFWTPYILENGTSSHYGFGWWVNKKRGLTEYWHTGITLGGSAHMSWFPDLNLSVILMANQTMADIHLIYNDIIAYLIGDKREKIIPQVSTLDHLRHIGDYSGDSSKLSIRVKEDHETAYIKCDILTEATYFKGEFPLVYLGDNRYYIKDTYDFYIVVEEDMCRLDLNGFELVLNVLACCDK